MAKQFRSGFFDMGTNTCDVCSETTQYHYQFFDDGSVICIVNGGCRGKDNERTPVDRAHAISDLKDRLSELYGSSQEEEEDEIGKIESFLSEEE